MPLLEIMLIVALLLILTGGTTLLAAIMLFNLFNKNHQTHLEEEATDD